MRKLKKSLALFLSLALIVGMVPLSVFSASARASGDGSIGNTDEVGFLEENPWVIDNVAELYALSEITQRDYSVAREAAAQGVEEVIAALPAEVAEKFKNLIGMDGDQSSLAIAMNSKEALQKSVKGVFYIIAERLRQLYLNLNEESSYSPDALQIALNKDGTGGAVFDNEKYSSMFVRYEDILRKYFNSTKIPSIDSIIELGYNSRLDYEDTVSLFPLLEAWVEYASWIITLTDQQSTGRWLHYDKEDYNDDIDSLTEQCESFTQLVSLMEIYNNTSVADITNFIDADGFVTTEGLYIKLSNDFENDTVTEETKTIVTNSMSEVAAETYSKVTGPVRFTIGSEENPFMGHFDGNNKTVNVCLDYSKNETLVEFASLFGVIDQYATVKNLTVDGYINGKYAVGAIAGMNFGTIENCTNKATIVGSGNWDHKYAECGGLGGIAGYNRGGVISNCSNEGSVSATYDVEFETTNIKNYTPPVVGGIAGNQKGLIVNCNNSGTISENLVAFDDDYKDYLGEDYDGEYTTDEGESYRKNLNARICIGGISGACEKKDNSTGLIYDSYNTGKIVVKNVYTCAGGITGKVYNDGKIFNSYNKGIIDLANEMVVKKAQVGGIVGRLYKENTLGYIGNCYSIGKINCNRNTDEYIGDETQVGSLVGCLSTGSTALPKVMCNCFFDEDIFDASSIISNNGIGEWYNSISDDSQQLAYSRVMGLSTAECKSKLSKSSTDNYTITSDTKGDTIDFGGKPRQGLIDYLTDGADSGLSERFAELFSDIWRFNDGNSCADIQYLWDKCTSGHSGDIGSAAANAQINFNTWTNGSDSYPTFGTQVVLTANAKDGSVDLTEATLPQTNQFNAKGRNTNYAPLAETLRWMLPSSASSPITASIDANTAAASRLTEYLNQLAVDEVNITNVSWNTTKDDATVATCNADYTLTVTLEPADSAKVTLDENTDVYLPVIYDKINYSKDNTNYVLTKSNDVAADSVVKGEGNSIVATFKLGTGGHNFTANDGVEATCRTAGEKASYYCTKCHNFVIDDERNAADPEKDEYSISEVLDTIVKASYLTPETARNYGIIGYGQGDISFYYNGQLVPASSIPNTTQELKDAGEAFDQANEAFSTLYNNTTITDDDDDFSIDPVPHYSDKIATKKNLDSDSYQEVTLTEATPATCMQTGEKRHFTCDECGQYFTDGYCTETIEDVELPIDPNNHNLEYTAKVSATCHSTGTEAYWTCTNAAKDNPENVCGKIFKDAEAKQRVESTDQLEIPVDSSKHSWSAAEYNKDATCEKDGTQTATCLFCGTTKTEIANGTQLEHSWDAGHVIQQPTTVAEGTTQYTCTTCGKATKNVSIAKLNTLASAKLAKSSYVYNGKAQTPVATVKGNDNQVLTEGVDYKVTYTNNKLVGKATTIIKGIGQYSGTIVKNFTIKPKATKMKSAKVDGRAITIRWAKKLSQAQGYRLQYSTSKNFKAAKEVTKVETIQNETITSFGTNVLKPGKYYLRVKTYKQVNGVRYYSGWSNVKTIRVK